MPPAPGEPRRLWAGRDQASPFEWKRRWINLYLTTGTAYKSEIWLKIVCQLVNGMETKEELQRANKERPEFSREFEALRDKADSVLRGLGKEGCK